MDTRAEPMNDPDTHGVRSTVHLFGHPIHPLLIPFPIAFLTAAAVTDVAFIFTADEFWARVSLWLIASGFLTGVVAAAVGLIDFLTIDRARSHRAGWVHLIGNVVVIGTAFVNWLLRIGDDGSFVEPWGLVLSLVIVAHLALTGWTGGELSYRHKIGVLED